MTELKAKDIVDATNGEVSYSAAGKWLKKENPSLAVRMALRFIGIVVGGSKDAPSSQPVSGKKLVTEDADGSNRSLTGGIKNYGTKGAKKEAVDWGKSKSPLPTLKDKIAKSIERPNADPSVPVATPCRYSGKDMTYRKGVAMNLPALYFTIGGLGYCVKDTKIKSFSVGGKLYSVSEFEEVD